MATTAEPHASADAGGPPSHAPRLCANCGAKAPGGYCPDCGQETDGLPVFTEFLRESMADLLSWESKGWRTLFRLLFAPGKLTVEYLAGRRVRYVRPLRLYLWISVLIIAFVEAFGLQLGLRFFGGEGIYLFEMTRPAEDAQTRIEELRPMQFVLEHFETPGVRRFKAMSAEDQNQFVQQRRHRNLQYFMLLLVPVFALMLQLCYRNRRRHYAEHLVFCLHTQSFLLLMLLAEAKMPGALAAVVSLWAFVYFFVALKRVYRGTWTDTLVRGTSTLALNISSFLVTGTVLVYLLLEL